MADMRKILTSLMEKSGDTASTLAKKSGVPQPTIYRFLNGETDDPRSSVVKKWAVVYGLSESQLRGDVPLPGHPNGIPHAETDEFRRQLLMFYGGMSQRHQDLLVMIANQLYSIDNPRDRGAKPFPAHQEQRHEEVFIHGVTKDRRNS
jgi:transcriptional regulator with XRE-family HTH domain